MLVEVTKRPENESDKKTELGLDLVFCACGGNAFGIILGSRCLLWVTI